MGIKRFYQQRFSSKTSLLIVILVFAGLGVLFIKFGLAASPTASLESETGSLSGNAQTTTDPSASGGSAVVFGKAAKLDSKVAGVYWPNWTTAPALRDIPSTYNLIYAAFAYGDGSNGGGVIWKPNDGSGYTPAAFKSDMQIARSKGQKIILSIGGAADLGVHMTNEIQVTEMVNSVNPIITEYGFDGIDWDLENLSNITTATLLSASRQFRTRWGPNFIIAAAPAPSATLYKDYAKQMGDDLDLFGMQFYDYAATDSDRIGGIKSRINEMVNNYSVSPTKLMIGCKNFDPDNPSFVSSPAVYKQAFDELEVTYPTLRGAFVWEIILDYTHGYPFANTVGVGVRNL